MSSADAAIHPLGRRSIVRDRLVRSIVGLEHRICVIQAPAGYGKSTLLQQAAEELGRRRIAYRWTPDPRLTTASTLESARRAPHQPEATSFVLVDSPPGDPDEEAGRTLSLIESLAEHDRIVIATRQPGVAKAVTARFLGLTVCYTTRDLLFTREEAMTLFHGRLGQDAIAQALEWSGAWPLGLMLIESDLLRSDTPVAAELDFEEPTEQSNAYFAGKVLAEISDPLRGFLLVCGDYAELDPHIVAQTTSFKNAASLLELAYDRGIFLERCDGRPQLYRFLPRFRSFLEDFQAAQAGPAPASLHRLLAAKFEAAGSSRAALHHAYRSGDKQVLAALLDRLGPFRIIFSQAYSALIYFRAVPDSVAKAFPMLMLARIYILHLNGNAYLARDLLMRHLRSDAPKMDRRVALYARLIEFVSRIHEDRAPSIAEMDACQEECIDIASDDSIAQSIIYRLAAISRYEAGQIQEALALSERVHQLALDEDLPFLRGFSSVQLGLSRMKMGDLAGADELLTASRKASIDYFGATNHQAALIGVVLARVRVEQLETESARKLLEDHLTHIELRPAWLFNSVEVAFTAAAFVSYETEGVDATLGYLYRKRDIFRISGLHNGDATLAMLQARALFRSGRIAEARAHLSDEPLAPALLLDLTPGGLAVPLLANIRLCHELVLSQEAEPAAQSRLDELERMVAQTHDVILDVSCRIARALHELRAGDSKAASKTLFHAVRLSARFNIARPIYESWRYLRPILGDRNLAFLSQQEAAFLERIRSRAADANASESEMLDGVSLSRRERQILLLLADGYSSKEMARALSIAIGTVKGYRRTLYEKLHIYTRSEAVAAARRLGTNAGHPIGGDAEAFDARQDRTHVN